MPARLAHAGTPVLAAGTRPGTPRFLPPDRHPACPFETDFFGVAYSGNLADFIDWTGTLGEVLPDNASSASISVQVVRGDDFIAANRLPPISLLKIDVEGFEEQALDGMHETLLRDRPQILLEIQPEGRTGRGQSSHMRSLLYPDHLLFRAEDLRGNYRLRPCTLARAEEALVLPAELAGIVPGTAR